MRSTDFHPAARPQSKENGACHSTEASSPSLSNSRKTQIAPGHLIAGKLLSGTDHAPVLIGDGGKGDRIANACSLHSPAGIRPS